MPQAFVFPREYHFPPFFTRQPNETTYHAQRAKWAALVLAYARHYRIYSLALVRHDDGSVTALPRHHGRPRAYRRRSSTSPSSGSIPSTAATTTTSDGPRTKRRLVLGQDLFHHERIRRRLAFADARDILEHLCQEGRAERANPSSSSSSRDDPVYFIYWRTPDEWASLLEQWVDRTGHQGSVLTVYEMIAPDPDADLDADASPDDRAVLGQQSEIEVEEVLEKGAIVDYIRSPAWEEYDDASADSAAAALLHPEFRGLDEALFRKALAILVKRGKAQIFGQDASGVKFF